MPLHVSSTWARNTVSKTSKKSLLQFLIKPLDRIYYRNIFLQSCIFRKTFQNNHKISFKCLNIWKCCSKSQVRKATKYNGTNGMYSNGSIKIRPSKISSPEFRQKHHHHHHILLIRGICVPICIIKNCSKYFELIHTHTYIYITLYGTTIF